MNRHCYGWNANLSLFPNMLYSEIKLKKSLIKWFLLPNLMNLIRQAVRIKILISTFFQWPICQWGYLMQATGLYSTISQVLVTYSDIAIIYVGWRMLWVCEKFTEESVPSTKSTVRCYLETFYLVGCSASNGH